MITAVNGRNVDDPESFQYRIATLPIGSTAHLGVMRKQSVNEFYVDIPPQSAARNPAGRTQRRLPVATVLLAGATVANISPANCQRRNPCKPVSMACVAIQGGSAQQRRRQYRRRTRRTLFSTSIIWKMSNRSAMSLNLMQQPALHGWRIYVQRGQETMAVMVGDETFPPNFEQRCCMKASSQKGASLFQRNGRPSAGRPPAPAETRRSRGAGSGSGGRRVARAWPHGRRQTPRRR